MSTETQDNKDTQEIDLMDVSKKIEEFFGNIQMRVFKGILFLKRNMITIGILFVIGAALGFYMDKTNKIYDSEIIVCPNFGSTDYLYSEIYLIESKIKDNDT